ncbi:HAD-IB family hydrolase [Pendulispora rubella]|uniref:HAD-IB family hydrolase n=1 Tax=Pendulispora rubella TaxID=2741070 RepID=A0ABZ2KUT4_9BACT
MPRAALFDLDRTLVRKETASLYVRYQRSIGEATWRDAARMSLWVAQYTLGVIDAAQVAAKAMRTLAGMPETVMAARCDDWFRRYVEEHVCDRGRAAVAEHHARGDIVAIVTGGSPYGARPLARRLGIEHVVASELEVGPDGRFTGRPIEPLAYGHGKVIRTTALAAVLGFRVEESVFYTDSYTDLPLLEAVAEQVVVNPDPRLSRIARRRGWRIETW